MQFTTKTKLLLKKRLPKWLYALIYFVSTNTILRIKPFIFRLRTLGFTKKMAKTVKYEAGEFMLVIDPQNGYLDAQLYTSDFYERHIVAEFIANIKKGDTCIDVGANIGHHTIIMSQLTGNTGAVIAFEPIPYIREQMNESLTLNAISNVKVLPYALSDSEGPMVLHINRGNVAGSSLVNAKGSEEIAVELRTLDALNFPKVDFMKIDVEGFEYHVLKGGVQTIEKCRPTILLEFSPEYYQRYAPEHSAMIIDFLRERNYKILDLEDNRKEVNDTASFVSEFNKGLRSQTNILALPQ